MRGECHPPILLAQQWGGKPVACRLNPRITAPRRSRPTIRIVCSSPEAGNGRSRTAARMDCMMDCTMDRMMDSVLIVLH